jgi:hypothetical protein
MVCFSLTISTDRTNPGLWGESACDFTGCVNYLAGMEISFHLILTPVLAELVLGGGKGFVALQLGILVCREWSRRHYSHPIILLNFADVCFFLKFFVVGI